MATYAQEQAEKLLKYYQGMSGTMRKPSALASAEERAAYAAQEVRAGRAPEEMLPEDYGGRPTGTSRRAIRMQEAYDVEMARRAEEERAAAAESRANQAFQMQLRDQQIQEEEAGLRREVMLTAQDLRHRTNQHVSGFMSGIRGGVDASGKEIPPLDPESPDYPKRIAELTRNFPLAPENPEIAPIIAAMNSIYNARLSADKERAAAREEAQEDFAKTTQSLLEAGVPEEELVQYYDTSEDVPAGVARYNPLKVARKLGITKAEEKAQTKATKEETPKEKIGLDLQQAYGELNSALMNDEDTAAARSKVAGLRARYEAATGEAAPEVLPKLKTREEYDRLPAGTPYIGKDGKKRIKQ